MFLDQEELTWIHNLYRLGRTTDEDGNPSAKWQHLLENIVGVFKASSGCLAELQGPGGQMKIQAGIGLPEGVVGSELAAGAGILGLVAAEGKPRLLNGNLSNDRKLADRLPRRNRPAPWSAMCWPLIVGDKVLGVISVNRSQEVDPFSEKDLERGVQLIDFISIAVENAQLSFKAEAHVAELKDMNRKQALWTASQEWLSNAQAELEKAGNLNQFCAQAAVEVRTLLNADWGALIIEGKSNGDLSIFVSGKHPTLENDLRSAYKNGLQPPQESKREGAFRPANQDALANSLGAYLTMPGSLQGVLMAGHENRAPAFDGNDETFLSTFTMSAQRALERIQLLNSLRRANQALKAECETLKAAIKQQKP